MRSHETVHVLSLIIAAIAGAAASTPASAQADCLAFVTDRPSPPVNPGALAVYDSVRGVQVYLNTGFPTEVWEWQGTWIFRDFAPSGFDVNNRAAVTFDSLRGRTLILDMNLSDTFSAWDGSTITPLPPLPNDQLIAASMTYDSARDVVVVFGGDLSFDQGDDTNDTWEFDGDEWTLLAPTTLPPARRNAVMSYDSARGVVVMFGGHAGPIGSGTLHTDTWEWDGIDWVERTVEPGLNPPSGLYNALSMTYDPVRERTFLVHSSGVTTYWEWDGALWSARQIPLNGVLSPTLVLDTAALRVRLTGPFGSALLARPEPPIVTQSPISATVSSGQPVLFTVEAIEGDPGISGLAYQWRHDGGDIPGANGTSYGIASAGPSDQGLYDCLVTYDGFVTDCGATLSEAATLTVNSSCPSDIDGDSAVAFGDILRIIADWGACP